MEGITGSPMKNYWSKNGNDVSRGCVQTSRSYDIIKKAKDGEGGRSYKKKWKIRNP